MATNREYAVRYGCTCVSCGSATTRRAGGLRLCEDCSDRTTLKVDRV